MELQCNSFKITKLRTTKISFIGIFGQNEFSCKQALCKSFYLFFITVFLTMSGKTNSVQMLYQLIQNVYFFQNFCLSKEMKDKTRFKIGVTKSEDKIHDTFNIKVIK